MFEGLFRGSASESEEEALKRAKGERVLRETEEAVESAERAAKDISEEELEAAEERRRKSRKEYPDTSPFSKERINV